MCIPCIAWGSSKFKLVDGHCAFHVCWWLLLFMSMGWDCISELRPLTGLPFITPSDVQVCSHGWTTLTGETEELRERPVRVPLCTPQSHMDWPGRERGTYVTISATNHLSHGMAEQTVGFADRELWWAIQKNRLNVRLCVSNARR
jgi:hypothetical protein